MRKITSLLLALALALLCSTQLLAQTTSPAQPLVLALNWKPEPQFGGFYAAQVNNDYQKNNLNVKITEGGSGTPTIQMLTAGKVDYAIVSADEVIIASARGAKNIVALFATYQTNPQGIITHAARGYESLEQVMHGDGVLLWQAGFMTIGGEWFGMWQSKDWNGVPSALRFVMVIAAVLIFVALPDDDLSRPDHS